MDSLIQDTIGAPSAEKAAGRPARLQSRQWAETLHRCLPVRIEGRIQSIRGTTISAVSLPTPVGSICEVRRRHGEPLLAETIGFDGKQTLLAPLHSIDGINQGDSVSLVRTVQSISVSPELVGRVINGLGEPIDELGPVPAGQRMVIDAPPVPAMQRPPIDQVLSTQIRAIDALLTIGEGQRIGVFAGSGVGKSTLLGMLARGTQADVVVIALIGERGREVREFLERDLSADGLRKCVTVVATSDQSASQRILAAKSATSVAEFFRDQGKRVLLLMDSVTRFAMAQREIGLAAGEVPTTRGYPPSVFSILPKLVERTGKTKRGSITAIYTVLVEGDDANEPISDSLRGLLDGHIHLSRSIGAKGRYPAIDILPSLSRLQSQLLTPQQMQYATWIRNNLSVYAENEDLLNIGAYKAGSNAEIDQAVVTRPIIERFLAQESRQLIPWEQTQTELSAIATRTHGGTAPRQQSPTQQMPMQQTPTPQNLQDPQSR